MTNRPGQVHAPIVGWKATQVEFHRPAKGIGQCCQVLHNYYLDCLGIFETEGWYAFTDTIASEVLLALASIRASTWASGARASIYTTKACQLPQVLRHPMKFANTKIHNMRARGLNFDPGERYGNSKLTGWNNPNPPTSSSNALPPPHPKWTGQQYAYRKGGPMSPIEHIFYRHGPASGQAGAGKFALGTKAKDVVRMVKEAGLKGQWIWDANGRARIVHDFKRPIGIHLDGTPATKLEVHLNEAGEVMTAYPRS